MNTVSSGLQGYFESNEDSIKHAGYKAVSSGLATAAGGFAGKVAEKSIDSLVVRSISKYKNNYEPLLDISKKFP